jgi:hypothetical protein
MTDWRGSAPDLPAELSGLGAAGAVRDRQRRGHIWIVAMTADAMKIGEDPIRAWTR